MSYFPNQGQQVSSRSQSVVPASDSTQFPTGNITTKYRNNCEALPSVSEWTTTTASGDLLVLDGNSNGASYWVLSKSPFNLGTESVIDGLNLFEMPVEISLGLHRSQGALNQEFAIEFVDNGATSSAPAEVAISALSQSTTTLTVTTSAAHNLVPGMSIGIYGCADSRFNYGSIVVASVISSTVFTATAGPGGTIASLTASPATLGSPMLYVRRRLGGSSDGTSLILENTSTTNGSVYVRSNNGDALATGTANGSHSATTSSTASSQSINAAGAYSFYPSSEFKLNFQADRVQWHSGTVDSINSTSNISTRSSICPDPSKSYKLRFRGTNNKGNTVPVGKIVSVVKSGSTTATVTFASAHGLTVDDYLVAYGVRDQTNFANITTAAKVASIVSSTVITIVWGTVSATATSYGGFMSRCQGNAAQNGAGTISVVSASITSSIVTVIFGATFTSASVGDYVELYGFRDTVAGNDLGLDGTYRVQSISTTTVIFEPIGGTTPPSSLASTNCGGGIIKRTDLRVSFIRIFDFIRERVEFSPRPIGDNSAGLPINANIAQFNNTTIASGVSAGSSNSTVTVNVGAAISQTDQSATAFAGSGRVNGTVVSSTRGGAAVISAEINVSSLTLGTATSVIFVLQESSGGTNFTDIWTSDPVTATGIIRVPPIVVGGRRRWAAHSVGGTSTTVTATITALELPPGSYPQIRQYRDGFAATNPFASVINTATQTATSFGNLTLTTQATSAAVIEGCGILTAHVVLSGAPTVTTQPVITLEVSQDLTNWIATSATITAAGNGAYSASTANIAFRYARLRVTTAGVYSAGNYSVSSAGITAIS